MLPTIEKLIIIAKERPQIKMKMEQCIFLKQSSSKTFDFKYCTLHSTEIIRHRSAPMMSPLSSVR